jgi:hypothetical protein
VPSTMTPMMYQRPRDGRSRSKTVSSIRDAPGIARFDTAQTSVLNMCLT